MTQTEPEFEPEPLRSTPRRVPPEWIDYNGHMNVAYYTLAFDRAMDEIFDRLGIGESLVREARMGPMVLQSMIHYLGEMLEGTRFRSEVLLIDADHKRTQFIATMMNLDTGLPAATFESLLINVDLEARRSAPYPDWAQARIQRLLAAQAALPRPVQAGASIAIRRKP